MTKAIYIQISEYLSHFHFFLKSIDISYKQSSPRVLKNQLHQDSLQTLQNNPEQRKAWLSQS